MSKFTPKYQEEIDAASAYALGDIVRKINVLDKEINKLEEEKQKSFDNISDILKESTIPLYSLWFYTDTDMHNNGGTKTITTKDELEKMFEHYKEGGLYIVELYDLMESAKQMKNIIPDFIDEHYKKMINNPNYNLWHNRILEKF